jgi:hypothetical protein
MKKYFASARGYHAEMPFAINASTSLLQELRAKRCAENIACNELFFAFRDDESIVPRLVAVLCAAYALRSSARAAMRALRSPNYVCTALR